MAKRTAWVFVALLLLASAFFVGALAMPESMEIAVGERTEISADGRTIKCTPPSNSPYAVCFFSDSPVSAVLYDGEETVAQGTGTGRLFSVVLNAVYAVFVWVRTGYAGNYAGHIGAQLYAAD